ncbi:pilus assembly protein PilM [Desulfurobacterium atlanticum]|uniref:Type IV pilus assembly protein PilM n=1 Tax=Desulfurobacterium atlanticum TaxID=240169 RepID=A0A238Z6N5_9BACT|nr:pilus assembly protein PilM [Desulfurobacterium atlanticum]SNR78638.1 type IV pilus assembly protein PilM [Desulfurobacterium atlanticum]
MLNFDSFIGVFTGRKSLYTGVDIGTSSVKVCRLKEGKGSYHIVSFGKREYGESFIVGTEIIDFVSLSSLIKETVESVAPDSKNVALHIPLALCFYTVISASPSENPEDVALEHIQGILSEEDIGKVVVKYKVLPVSITKENIDIAIAAVKRDILEEYVALADSAGLAVQVIDIEPAALNNQFYLNYPDKVIDPVCLVDIGATFTKIVISFGGFPYLTRNIEMGSNSITEQLQKEYLISYEEAERLKLGENLDSVSYEKAFEEVISKIIKKIATETIWAIDNFKDRFEQNVEEIFVYGGGSKQKNLISLMKDCTNKNIEIGKPFYFDGKDNNQEYAISCGLSLRYKGDENAKI